MSYNSSNSWNKTIFHLLSNVVIFADSHFGYTGKNLRIQIAYDFLFALVSKKSDKVFFENAIEHVRLNDFQM